jgi:hypothetical protein
MILKSREFIHFESVFFTQNLNDLWDIATVTMYIDSVVSNV